MQQISADEVKKIMETSSDYVLLDVRTVDEYKRGNIQNSIHIPLDILPKEVEKIISDKQTQLIVYCLSGSRSIVAASILESLGYTHVQNMTSGLLAWRAKGYPLITS